MIDTVNELSIAFDNSSSDRLINDEYINSQNICQYCSGDEGRLLYGEMNCANIMFNYDSYSDRILGYKNMKSGKCHFKDVYGEAMWNAFSKYRESAFGIDAVVCQMPDSIEVAVVEHLIWYPERGSVKPVIVMPAKFDYWDMNRAKAWLYPEIAYYTYLIVDSVARDNQICSEYPLMIVKDYKGRFVVYDMSIYLASKETGKVLQAIMYLRRIIGQKVSTKKNIKEGEVCIFK